ncbi:Oidioi.mRNA.OKI2018_I69.PAR.g12039.t1.cds [Oikopleura dioica]|uniref:Oidioi.mRNA.OKI2018_I69.PAR.g12039.t1.cds n=1 Tax=Oikopleura dioica TaxID=34765 RepID=A0ABN7S4P7_OIKDI|nr:Oidioi.mRNA.OKI2018_I69.PAR.g12039.t1.cds [Oikopleura dioica]
MAKLQKLRYFEITKDAFHDQIMAALRLDEPLLIYANSSKLSQESWKKVMTLVTTKDIFSIIDFEDVFRALDPTGYYKNMSKVRDTAIEKIQQRWLTQMVFVLAIDPSHLPEINKHLPSSFRINVDRWEESDWMTTAHHLIKSPGKINQVCTIFAAYMTKLPVHFSPEYGSKILKEYDELVKIKSQQISAELEETKAVNNSIQEAHDAFSRRTLEYNDDKERLDAMVKNLEELRKASDDALEEYRTNFNKNLEIEQRFSHLQQIVNVLREETDISSRVHPLFQKAQNVLKNLDIRDFEEIRTYRKPPASVVLVVESICLLFNEEPTFECGTTLLHKDNFFLELEFFEKEKVTKQAFQKLRHRLERVDEKKSPMRLNPLWGCFTGFKQSSASPQLTTKCFQRSSG